MSLTTSSATSIIGEPEVVEDGRSLDQQPAWLALKTAATSLHDLQAQDGSIPDGGDHERARTLVATITAAIGALAPLFPHDEAYLAASVVDVDRWTDGGFGVPDFLDSLVAFQPQQHRVDGLAHLVVFPMYTQNGSRNRFVEAVLCEVIWPELIADIEQTYTNGLFVSLRLIDFTPGYDTNLSLIHI